MSLTSSEMNGKMSLISSPAWRCADFKPRTESRTQLGGKERKRPVERRDSVVSRLLIFTNRIISSTPAESVMLCGTWDSRIFNQHFPVMLREHQKEGLDVSISSIHLHCIA